MQREITEKTDLLTPGGTLAAPGYARQMVYRYNRERVRSFPLKLKEWNFYQIQKDHYSLQLTFGHVSYMCSVAATLIDLKTGQKWELGTMKPLWIPCLDRDPEGKSFNLFESKDLRLCFEVTENSRILTVTGNSPKWGAVDISIRLENDLTNEKMVISTPFANPRQFYLNYKENYYAGAGHVRFGETEVDFDGCTGLVDWGRGVWPFSHEWFWGNLTGHIEGVPFGFNIGWGFGDLRNATENMFFYNRKAYKLGVLQVERDEHNYMKPWRLADPDGLLEMTFTPIFNNYTENKYVVVDTHCNQVYGTFTGFVKTEDGKKEFKDLLAFIEHAVNRW